jgi:RNA polymerase sigma-70 factor (ECF subfamily)
MASFATTTQAESTEAALVAAARDGDDVAFQRLTDPYIRELRVHCYRILGSLHEAEDLLQETLLRAWQNLGRFEGRSSLRVWLYRIATNACLNARRSRRRQLPPRLHGPPSDPYAPLVPATEENLQLEPFPDSLLVDPDDPESYAVAREGIALAFITAIQLLPPRQRAVLILREVLGWSAAEVAELLDTSVPAVNSALQRARRALDEEGPVSPDVVVAETDEGEALVLERFMQAWDNADMTSLATLLREDAEMTMPPEPQWFAGRDPIVTWFATSPFVFGDPTRRFRMIRTRANGLTALAVYTAVGDTRQFDAYGIMVLRLEDGVVAEITGFGDGDLHRFFGLPDSLAPGEDTLNSTSTKPG